MSDSDRLAQLLIEAGSGGTVVFTGASHGDSDGDNVLSIQDLFYDINYLFAGGPDPRASGDCDGDGRLTIADLFYLINYLFSGGPPPV